MGEIREGFLEEELFLLRVKDSFLFWPPFHPELMSTGVPVCTESGGREGGPQEGAYAPLH